MKVKVCVVYMGKLQICVFKKLYLEYIFFKGKENCVVILGIVLGR